MEEGAAVISLEKIFLWESEQNGLYSELIKSFMENGKAIPGSIAVEYLKCRLKAEDRRGNIVVKSVRANNVPVVPYFHLILSSPNNFAYKLCCSHDG